MDEKFDKLLDCQIADMKNITGVRGAGSITAAQFLQRFVNKTPWAHLDIAGVAWSNKEADTVPKGGTGYGGGGGAARGTAPLLPRLHVQQRRDRRRARAAIR